MQAMKQASTVFMGDLSETFVEGKVGRDNWSTLQHKTARGAMILQWLCEQDMQAPSQEMDTSTYYPYNQLHRPRRLDYIFYKGIEEGAPGRVHQLRHLASSDHDAVTTSMRVSCTHTHSRRDPPATQHGAKQLKTEDANRALRQSRAWRGDRMKNLQRLYGGERSNTEKSGSVTSCKKFSATIGTRSRRPREAANQRCGWETSQKKRAGRSV